MKETQAEVRDKSVICYQAEHNNVKGERKTERVV